MKKWACIKIWVCVFVSSKVICFSPFPISCSSPLVTKHTLDAQVMCPSPYTFGWIASKSHASLPTLWMNGPPSHMLLLHSLDEWATKSHASSPHFGWMGLSSATILPKRWTTPTMSPIKVFTYFDKWGSTLVVMYGDHHNTSHIVQLTWVHDKTKKKSSWRYP